MVAGLPQLARVGALPLAMYVVSHLSTTQRKPKEVWDHASTCVCVTVCVHVFKRECVHMWVS